MNLETRAEENLEEVADSYTEGSMENKEEFLERLRRLILCGDLRRKVRRLKRPSWRRDAQTA
jgi:hypothetical protein